MAMIPFISEHTATSCNAILCLHSHSARLQHTPSLTRHSPGPCSLSGTNEVLGPQGRMSRTKTSLGGMISTEGPKGKEHLYVSGRVSQVGAI